MSLEIHLVGRPRLVLDGGDGYRFRSRKSWALLAYLLLNTVSPTRSQLAALLFGEADDPMRALRWSLAEIRRGLGVHGSVDGDPVALTLAPDVMVDVRVLVRGAWTAAAALPGLGEELLEGVSVRGAPAFDTWLLARQRQVAAASEAILHEAALGSLSTGDLEAALGFAVRAATMNPLDENTQALVIRLYRLTGDDAAAERQLENVTDLLERELGVVPGPAVLAANRESRYGRAQVVDATRIEAVVEAGVAAVAAGVVDVGTTTLRAAARLADETDLVRLRVGARLALAEALIHSARGFDEEGSATLYEVDEIARANGMPEAVAQARAELGYVDFLRARYDRAEVWLKEALREAAGRPSIAGMALTYLGALESDRGDYGRATALLGEGIEAARGCGEVRRETYALSMLGRAALLRGDLDSAATHLEAAVARAERDHWLSFLPWPQALRGEVLLARGEVEAAAQLFEQAFARACQLGDPCWEGIAGRGLALVAEARGDVQRAFELMTDARARAGRAADSYVWLTAHILDAQADLGIRQGHPDAGRWVDQLRELTSRTGMRALLVRSLQHGAELGREGDAEAAGLLAPTSS